MGRTITGVIREVDLGRRTVTLRDGTELWVPPEQSMGGLSGGLPIKAAWEDEGGRRRVREIRANNVPP
jgi:hypothetical protein